jgi:hypothetical protein
MEAEGPWIFMCSKIKKRLFSLPSERRSKNSTTFQPVQEEDGAGKPKMFDSLGYVWLIILFCYFQIPAEDTGAFNALKEWG